MIVERLSHSQAIHLTFDDGPHETYTSQVLDVLAEHGVQATFFVVGKRCEAHPEIIRRMIEEGHSVGNHTYSHVRAGDVPSAAWKEEVRRCDQALESIAATSTPLVRPPHGDLRAVGLLSLWRSGKTVVLWNVDPKDYACTNADDLRSWLSNCPPRSGDIVLLHDVNPWTPTVLAELIESAQQRGDHFARIPSTVQHV